MENTKEELDVRGAACTATGAICSRLIKERGKATACSTSRSDQRKLKKEMDSIDTAKEALKKQMDCDPEKISLPAARAFMSLPASDISIFKGSVTESAFSFADPLPTTGTDEKPAEVPAEAEQDSPAETKTAEITADTMSAYPDFKESREKDKFVNIFTSKSQKNSTDEGEGKETPVKNIEKPVEIAPDTW